jgi:outer membrane protein
MSYFSLKNVLLLSVVSLFWVAKAHCQRIGYINTKVIYEKLPEYKQAQNEINNLITNWNNEIKSKEEEQRRLIQEFEMDAPLLTQAMRDERLNRIRQIEQELREFQNKRFGYKGMLSIKKEQVLDPVKEKVYQATDRVAKIKRVDFFFDIAADLSLPYVRASKDYTDFVLEQLGVKIKEN